jgi:hypothetical protein
MENTSRPTTKALLIRDSLDRLEIKYRYEFVSGLLYGRVRLPASWLEPMELLIVELEFGSTLDDDLEASALELTDRVIRPCDLFYRLIDNFSGRHGATLSLDHQERASLRRSGGSAAVRGVPFLNRRAWPAADPQRLPSVCGRQSTTPFSTWCGSGAAARSGACPRRFT